MSFTNSYKWENTFQALLTLTCQVDVGEQMSFPLSLPMHCTISTKDNGFYNFSEKAPSPAKT